MPWDTVLYMVGKNMLLVIIEFNCNESTRRMCQTSPLYNPANITGIKARQELMPNIPQWLQYLIPHFTKLCLLKLSCIPTHEIYQEHKVRRYGFHGTSHKYVAGRAAKLLVKI